MLVPPPIQFRTAAHRKMSSTLRVGFALTPVNLGILLQTYPEAYLRNGAKPHQADHKLGQAFSETGLGSSLQPPSLNT